MVKKNILCILTGGTFGMTIGKPALKPSKVSGEYILNLVPELDSLANIKWISVFDLDSSNLDQRHWINIANTIKKNYNIYDGFVIIHGTDTMVYTSTAISFMIKNTEKPIIFTGSQRPLSAARNDARKNLIDAVEFAIRDIPEVAISFNSKLIRANRAKKISISDYDAFISPNYPCLASSGVDININKPVLIKKGQPNWNLNFDKSIALIKIYPGLDADIYSNALIDEKVKAVIIEGFGSGNIPELDEKWLNLIKKLRAQDNVVLISSQCLHGIVDLSKYENGINALNSGAISAGDITTEALIVKLMFLLANEKSYNKMKIKLQNSYCGELTT